MLGDRWRLGFQALRNRRYHRRSGEACGLDKGTAAGPQGTL